MNVSQAKIKQYFMENGADPESAAEKVEIRSINGVVSIDRWDSDAPVRPPDSYWETAPEYNPVPQRVSPRQFRLALIGAGVDLANVDAAIAALPDATERAAAEVEWEYANYVDRNNAFVLALAPSLGFDTDEKIDNLFRAARAI